MKLPQLNLRKIRGFLYQHRLSASVVLVSVLVAIGAAVYFLSQDVQYVAPVLKVSPKKVVDTRVEAPLTGEKVEPAAASRRAIAVVIENFYPDARPQSGYNEADIVYETMAEGGITRTLAIYQSKDAKEIGPVRSARPVFVDWSQEYSAPLAHVGGSDEALALISQLHIPDLNQFFNGSYFWRSNDRYAPHNVYTSTEKLYAASKANGFEVGKPPTSFSKFMDDTKEVDRPASQNISIDFSSSVYRASYAYDSKTNTYLRSIGGSVAADKNTKIQVAPKNVIAIYAKMAPYVNSSGKSQTDIVDVGAGTGYLFQNGKQVPINWSKASRAAATKYTDSSSADIQLVRGQTWIEVVPSDRSITY